MKEINLREYYPELYTEDSVISVSDEIAEMMRRSILEEKAYQRRQKLQKAFRTLTPSQQRRIYKRYFLCMSCAEIARSEGYTISAVCNSIHRSLKKLKKNYDL